MMKRTRGAWLMSVLTGLLILPAPGGPAGAGESGGGHGLEPGVVMGDGNVRSIGAVSSGDLVLSFDLGRGLPEPQPAGGLRVERHPGAGDDYAVELEFSDGSTVTAANDHAYYDDAVTERGKSRLVVKKGK